jgi:CRISPR system Cascade subunit CasA
MYNLLSEPLIGICTANGNDRVTLPELLARLSAGKVEGYTGLRAHQADPWHVFLVQLAASIQARFPTDTLPTDPTYWCNGLLDLADGQESAWHLLVEDVTKPAFMQHPWKSWEEEAKDYGVEVKRGKVSYEPKATAPDELDVLITAKNHDLKIARIHPDLSEAWLYALVIYQTTSGFLGQGNYGIVRMNGGFASRPIVAWVRDRHPSRRFVDEVQQLKAMRPSVLSTYGYRERGIVLTWLKRWDRSAPQHTLAELEPWFIEAARPLRLRPFEGGLIALGATSKARQIGPKSLENGDVGDPWIPFNAQDKKKGLSALTLSQKGWTPQLLTDLLFQKGYRLTPLQEPKPGEGVAWFVASCLVRGQGRLPRVEIPAPQSWIPQTHARHPRPSGTSVADRCGKYPTRLGHRADHAHRRRAGKTRFRAHQSLAGASPQ